jgi:small subunit ribosomal protein S2
MNVEDKTTKNSSTMIEALFSVGAHFGRSKSRRHPSTKSYIFGKKNNTEIVDLEKTVESLDKAKEFVNNIVSSGKQILFVGTKPEAKKIIANVGVLNIPFVSERWIGGTLTNFSEIKKRVARLTELLKLKETGELEKYTKKEQLMMDREVEKLSKNFGGIVSMNGFPGALFVVDSKHEKTAVEEAIIKNIPIISLSSSDCDISKIDYPIVANDASQASVEYFTNEILNAYKDGQSKEEVSIVNTVDEK